MLTTRIALASVVTILGLVSGTTAKADYAHIDNLAARLQRQAREMEREFREHYSHAVEFRHLVSDARELAGRAAHIHEVAHHGGSPYHLREDLAEMDRLFHHVEGLVARMERAARFGRGHVHGDTRHVRGMLRAMSDTLHHLKEDVERMTDHGHGHGGHGHGGHGHGGHGHGGHGHGGHGHGGHGHVVGRPGVGIVIGGSGFRIGFGF